MNRDLPSTLSTYPIQLPVSLRWSDNDIYGHVNNAVYFELFDTAINFWLHSLAGGDFGHSETINVVAQSGCQFFEEMAFPGTAVVGLGIERLGRSSVTYRLGAFSGESSSAQDLAAASGHWVHVHMNRSSRRPEPIPDHIRAVMNDLL